MRTSALISIRHIIEQAIDAINDSFEREKQSQKISAEFGKEYERLLALTEGDTPNTELEQSSTKQHQRVPLPSPRIEGFYPWRHRVVLAANALAECEWTIEARAIHEELNKLPTHQVDWAQPGARDHLRDEIRVLGTRIRDVLTCCLTELQASKSDARSILQSSKPENATRTVDNFDVAQAREQLRPYVEINAFRQYVTEQITLWERWHFSQTEQIKEYEGRRDSLHQELKELQGRGFRRSDDPADFDPLGHAEICYENYRDIAAGLTDDPEYKLVADREPVLFKEPSVAAIVALFWCDINHSTLLVPEYDFLEREGPFIEHVRKQWRDPIDGRYIHIDWMVQAAVDAYERKGPVDPQAEESFDTADKMQEALAPAESSHAVPERTTLKQPSGNGDAEAEAKPTLTVWDEAVQPETTASTTTEQKKPVIESEQNKKTQSNDDPHRTTQKSQSETVQLTEELKVVAFLTDGVGSEVVEKVASIVRSSKSLDDKLHQVDQIIKIPAKSSRKLGTMFGVSHSAIQKTGWWKKNHKSAEDRFAEREARLKERGKRSGLLPDDDE